MKRRNFLKKLGIASGVAVATPLAVSAFVPKKPSCIEDETTFSLALPEGKTIELPEPCDFESGKIKRVWLHDPDIGEGISIGLVAKRECDKWILINPKDI